MKDFVDFRIMHLGFLKWDHEFHNIGMGVEKTIFRADECSFNGQNNGLTIKLCVILLFIVLSLIIC